MPDEPQRLPPKPALSEGAATQAETPVVQPAGDAMPCDRCGAQMFRMHAVWRCPACGFKTDCCGW